LATPFYTVESLGPSQKLTPEGFLIIHNVPLARTGPQLYSEREVPVKGDSAGRVIIDRDPEEVFRPETIASLQGKPVAVEHPDEDVTPTNYKELAVGHVINPRRGEGPLDNLLLADLMITCPDAIKAIRSKQLREVSVGYEADYEDGGNGRGRQRNILANHLALVRDGRCGPICRIGDSADQLHNFADKDNWLRISQKQADYVPLSPDDHERCGNCTNWHGKGECDKVTGEICADGWCKLFLLSSTAHDEATVDWSMIEELGRRRLTPKRNKHFHLHVS